MGIKDTEDLSLQRSLIPQPASGDVELIWCLAGGESWTRAKNYLGICVPVWFRGTGCWIKSPGLAQQTGRDEMEFFLS